ncbi:hypothetical protein L6R49_27515 [Myxococcota bacterium]|nr:hypothetical protein [Myxococcota bacterium]
MSPLENDTPTEPALSPWMERANALLDHPATFLGLPALLAAATRLPAIDAGLPYAWSAQEAAGALVADPDAALRARIVVALLGVFSASGVALAGARLIGRREGLIAGLILALAPASIQLTFAPAPEAALLVFAVAALCLLAFDARRVAGLTAAAVAALILSPMSLLPTAVAASPVAARPEGLLGALLTLVTEALPFWALLAPVGLARLLRADRGAALLTVALPLASLAWVAGHDADDVSALLPGLPGLCLLASIGGVAVLRGLWRQLEGPVAASALRVFSWAALLSPGALALPELVERVQRPEDSRTVLLAQVRAQHIGGAVIAVPVELDLAPSELAGLNVRLVSLRDGGPEAWAAEGAAYALGSPSLVVSEGADGVAATLAWMSQAETSLRAGSGSWPLGRPVVSPTIALFPLPSPAAKAEAAPAGPRAPTAFARQLDANSSSAWMVLPSTAAHRVDFTGQGLRLRADQDAYQVCSVERAPVNGAVRVKGFWKLTAISQEQGGARVSLRWMDEQGRAVEGATATTVSRASGNTPRRAIQEIVTAPEGAARARLCVDVPAGSGELLVDGLRIHRPES